MKHGPSPATVADRLMAMRHANFVGRTEPLTLFCTAIEQEQWPFQVLICHGVPGIGKTSLLFEYEHLCVTHDVRYARLDGRDIDPDPQAFLVALRTVLDLDPEDDVLKHLNQQSHRMAIFVDVYENLRGIDRWIRESFAPKLPASCLLVLAGRQPPAAGWRADAGWRELVKVVALDTLSSKESQQLLTKRGVPSDQCDAIVSFTQGHALALCLVADQLAQDPYWRFDPVSAQEIVAALVDAFTVGIDDPIRKAALEVCALLRRTTEDVLQQLVAEGSVADLFKWLQSLSFMESTVSGVCPHALAREAIVSNLRWRNPTRYEELLSNARALYLPRINEHEAWLDYVFLHRKVADVFAASGPAEAWPDSLRASDRKEVLAMTRRHEGKSSFELINRWLDVVPESFVMFRDDQDRVAGYVFALRLERWLDFPLPVDDPGAARALAYLAKCAPLRPGECALFYRTWMAREEYQDLSPVMQAIMTYAVHSYLTTAGLAHSFWAWSDPERWEEVSAYGDMQHLADVDFSIGDRHFGVYGHDWRVVPPPVWLERVAAKELEQGTAPESERGPAPRVLNQKEFGAAVGEAIRSYNVPTQLSASPLLDARIVRERSQGTDRAARVAALRGLLQQALETLGKNPNQRKFERALIRRYIAGAPTHEAAAETLNVSVATVRRHIDRGVQAVTEILWDAEVGNPS